MPKMAPKPEEVDVYRTKLHRLSIEWRRLEKQASGVDVGGEDPRHRAAQYWIDVIEIGDLEDFRCPIGWPDGLRPILERIRGERSFYPHKLDELDRLRAEFDTVVAPFIDNEFAGKTPDSLCPESIDTQVQKVDDLVLSGLFDLGACDPESSVKEGTLRHKLAGLSQRKYKESIRRLKKHELAQTKPGPDGGVWLSGKGRNLVQSRAHAMS
jgi:hypothetical protein